MSGPLTLSERIEQSIAWRGLDKAWPWLIPAIGAALCLLGDSSPFLFTVLFSGVLCVVFAARGSIWNYPIGLYNSIAYAYVAWGDKLYGEVLLNLLFFVPMNVVGFILWRNKMQGGRVTMRNLSWRMRGLIAVCVVVGTAGVGLALNRIAGQVNTPYVDAFTNVVSILATILMAYRYKEQWACYIVLNVATILMWAIRLQHGSEAGWTMVAMWSLFLVNACYGYAKWSFGARADARQISMSVMTVAEGASGRG